MPTNNSIVPYKSDNSSSLSNIPGQLSENSLPITDPNASKNNLPQKYHSIPSNNNAENQNNTGFFSYFKSFGSSLFTGISSITSSFLNVFSWPKDKIFSLFVKITKEKQNSNSSTNTSPTEKKEEEKKLENNITENDPSENNEKKNEITNNTTKEQAIKSTITTRTRSSSFDKNPSPSKQLKKSNSLDDIKSITKEKKLNNSIKNNAEKKDEEQNKNSPTENDKEEEQPFGQESIDDLENQSKPTNKEIEEFEKEEEKINNYPEENPLTNTEDPFKEEEEEEDNKNIETNLTDTKCKKSEEEENENESNDKNDQHKNLEEKIRNECEKFAHNKRINKTPEEFARLDPQERSDNLKEWQEQKAKDWQKWSDTERKQFAKDMKKFKFVDYNKWLKQFNELIKQTPTEPHDLENLTMIDGVLFDENVNNSGLSFSEALYYVEHSSDLAVSSFESDNNPDAPNPTLSGDHKHFEENSDSL
ncbi:MAG TPA: hypothetical protein QKA08_02655 [Candidatus Megaira endosymbiont of Nemacystus decipiens]|nr:hypothetical protein [Candidatus Megaera endosymbiont of Nemacystus decipiens]